MPVSQAKLLGIAFRHLSFFGASRLRQEDPSLLGKASIYFPLVGFVFGAGFILTYSAVASVAGIEWACLTVLAVMVGVFTGRQYQSCLKFIEVFGRSEESEDGGDGNAGLTLDIVRVLFIFGLFMLKFLALAHLGKGWITGMLATVPVVSCWSKVYLCHSFASSVPDSGGLSWMRFVKGKEF